MLRRWILLLFAFTPSFICADSNTAPSIPPQIVTVSSEAIPLDAVSASVTLITAEEIENSHAENVGELLRDAPFLHISQVGSIGGLTAVTLRGGDPNFTLVLIDGIPVNDPTNLLGGSFDFSLLSTDNIERIEIVRGPLSSLYGSQAMSGVINIISKKGAASQSYSVEGFLGNFGSHQFRASGQPVWKSIATSISASYFGIGEQVENDSSSLGTISLTSDIGMRTAGNLGFTFRYDDESKSGFPENGGGPEFSILRDPKKVDAHDLIFGSEYRRELSRDWNIKADVDFFHHLEDSKAPAILDAIPPSFQSIPSISSHADFDRFRFRIFSTWKIAMLRATAGAELQDENGKSDSLIAETFPSNFSLQRTTQSYSGEATYASSAWSVNAGFRLDHAETFDTQFSPRVGFSYLFSGSGTRIRTTWGKGFKLPSFYALGDPNVGNPELQPETIRSFDAGIEQQLGSSRAIASITYFYSRFENLIDFSAEEFRLVNRSRAISRGFEAETKFQMTPNINVGAHLDYVNAVLLGTSDVLRDRPKWRGGLDLAWRVTNNMDFRANWISVGDRFDFQLPVPERNIAPGYHTVDASFDWKIARSFILYSRIDNVLDSRYEEFVGFPNPGRYIRAGVKWSVQPISGKNK